MLLSRKRNHITLYITSITKTSNEKGHITNKNKKINNIQIYQTTVFNCRTGN